MFSHFGEYAEKFKALNVHKKEGKSSPHKACLLLAVIDAAERGKLVTNRINIYDNSVLADMNLVNSFRGYMQVANPSGLAKISNPMLRMKSDGFWHLSPKPGRESYMKKIPQSGGYDYQYLRENVDFIYLDDELHNILMDTGARSTLRDLLIDTWFPNCRQEMHLAASSAQEELEYEQNLKNDPLTQEKPPKDEVRKPVFRRLVLSAYDHCCAATGLRFLMLDGSSLLEAAHIKPFSISHDDRTANGMALEPTFHRAMDQYLIAPGPDLKWHVSVSLDERISGHKELKKLKGESLLIPRDRKHCPDKHALEWRLDRLYEREL